MGLFFSFHITRQTKLLEIHVFCRFFQEENFRNTLPYHSWTTTGFFFHYLYTHVCLAERKKYPSPVLSEELWTTWGAPECSLLKKKCKSCRFVKRKITLFGITMKESSSSLQFSKPVSSNIVFPFLSVSCISHYGIILKCCCLCMQNITSKRLPNMSSCDYIVQDANNFALNLQGVSSAQRCRKSRNAI